MTDGTDPPSQGGAPLLQGAAPLRVVPVWKVELAPETESRWLVEGLWGEEAVGLIGGAPKCGKTWLALEIALAVASGTACLGAFRVPRPGNVLVLAAEDSPPQVRERLEGLARVRGVPFDGLNVGLVLAPALRLERERDRERLEAAVGRHQPRLLVLDPFIRLHGADENSASEISAILAALRDWQRRFHTAILVVHHARKGNGATPGMALRGSSDFHAWGDSNLYLQRADDEIVLSIEHRSAPSPDPMRLRLAADAGPAHLKIGDPGIRDPEAENLAKRILSELRRAAEPSTVENLRTALRVRNQHLADALRDLVADKRVIRHQGRIHLGHAEQPLPTTL